MSCKPLVVSYDERLDTLTIDDVKYSGQMFRAFAHPDRLSVLRIVKRSGGMVTVQQSHIDEAVAGTLFGDASLLGERITLDHFAPRPGVPKCGS